MTVYEIECPLCESTDYVQREDGMYECVTCSTSWGVHGRSHRTPTDDTFARKVAEKLRRYSDQ